MRRGDIWLVAYDDPAAAGEPATVRPAVIVSSDRFNVARAWTILAVPLTTTDRGNPLHVVVDSPDLEEVSHAQVELVGAVSRRRLLRRIGRVDPVASSVIDERLRMVMEL